MSKIAVCQFCKAEFDASGFEQGEQFECSECRGIVTVRLAKRNPANYAQGRKPSPAHVGRANQGKTARKTKKTKYDDEQECDAYDESEYPQSEYSNNKKIVFIAVMGGLILSLSVLLIIFASQKTDAPKDQPKLPTQIADENTETTTNNTQTPQVKVIGTDNNKNEDATQKPPERLKTQIVRSNEYKAFIDEFNKLVVKTGEDIESFVDNYDETLKNTISRELRTIIYTDFRDNEKLKNPDDYFYAGLLFIRRRGSIEAIECFTNSLDLLENNLFWQFGDNKLMAYFFRGVENYKLNNAREAIEDFNEAIMLNDNFTNAYFYRARIWFSDNNWQKCLDDLEKILKIQPNSELIHEFKTMLERCRRELNIRPKPVERTPEEIKEAIEKLTNQIELEKDERHLYALYYNRGVNYTGLKDWNSALKDFDQSLTEAYKQQGITQLEMLNIKRYRVICLRELEKLDEALEEINILLNQHPDLPILLATRGLIFLKMKRYAAALADLEYAADLDSNLANSDQIKDAIAECKSNR